MGKQDSLLEEDNLLRIYLNQASETPLLSLEEERELACKVQQGDEQAREQMIKANLLLVVKIALDFARSKYFGPKLDSRDLICEGNIGLMMAVARYNPYNSQGAKFSYYAGFWIRQRILRAIGNQINNIRIPLHHGQKIRKIRKTMGDMTEELGYVPSIRQLALRLKEDPDKVKDCLDYNDICVSLDSPISSDDGSRKLSDIIPDESEETPDQVTLKNDDKKIVEELIAKLKPREREIISRRFGLNGYEMGTLVEVGDIIGVTRERIRQIEVVIINKLRIRLKSENNIHRPVVK